MAWLFAHFPDYIIIKRHTKVNTWNLWFYRKWFSRSFKLTWISGQLYRCPEAGCEKEYKTEHLLRRHLKVHRDHRDGNLKCPHCEKTFCRADYLEIHIKRHLGQKDEKCPECGKGKQKSQFDLFSLQISGFVCKSDLIRHKLNVHSAYGRYQCPDCGKRLRSNTSLNRHRQSRLCIKQLFPGTYADNEVRLSWVSYIVLTSFNHILQTLILNSVRHSIHLWRQSARLVKWVRAAPEAAARVAAGASGRDGIRRIANTANLPTPSDSWNTICNNFEWESGRAE